MHVQALQASLRNLLLDITPADQLGVSHSHSQDFTHLIIFSSIQQGNAWHGRMIHGGNVIGFGIGAFAKYHSPLGHSVVGMY